MKKVIISLLAAAACFGAAIVVYILTDNNDSLPPSTEKTASSHAKPTATSKPVNTIDDFNNLTERTDDVLLELAKQGADNETIKEARDILGDLSLFFINDDNLCSYIKTLKETFDSVIGYLDGSSSEKDLGNRLKNLEAKTEVLSKVTDINLVTVDKYPWFYATAACYERGQKKPGEITITAVGDCSYGTFLEAPSNVHFDVVFDKVGRRLDYVFQNCFSWFNTDDYTVVNNETAMTYETKHKSKPYPIKSKPEHAMILPASGIEGANLANNHTRDFFDKGYQDTLKALKDADVDAFDDGMPLIRKIGGIDTVFLGYNCMASVKNEALLKRIVSDITRYKKDDVLVLVGVHWGYEYKQIPAEYQVRYAHSIIDAGADIIFGGHPHVLQGIELYKGKYIIYSMGDFAFGADPFLNSINTCMFRAVFAKENNRVVTKGLRIVPCYENSDGSTNRNNFQPLPLFGQNAEKVVKEIKNISKEIKNGVSEFDFFNPFS